MGAMTTCANFTFLAGWAKIPYDAQGRTIKWKHPTTKRRRQEQTEARLAERYRREAAHRKTSHGQLANQIIAQGPTIKTEKLSYKAFQKQFGRSIWSGPRSCF